MSFFGKEYTFEREENFEEMVKSLGLTPEQEKGFLNYRPVQKLVQDGDTYKLVSVNANSTREVAFKSGVPFEEKTTDRVCQTTFTLDGNVLKQTQKFADGNEMNYVREFSDNQLVVTITGTKFNGSARRYYKA